MNGEEHTLYFHKPNKFLLFFFWATAWGFRNYVLSERPSLFQVKKKISHSFHSLVHTFSSSWTAMTHLVKQAFLRIPPCTRFPGLFVALFVQTQMFSG